MDVLSVSLSNVPVIAEWMYHLYHFQMYHLPQFVEAFDWKFISFLFVPQVGKHITK